jgi:asparagine synthase (glutamine-hydrolysing)
MKHVFREVVRDVLPREVTARKDKMGFPVPLTDWMHNGGRDFFGDVFGSQAARDRELFDNQKVLRSIDSEAKYGRKVWGLLSLELWQRRFHDRSAEFRSLLTKERTTV